MPSCVPCGSPYGNHGEGRRVCVLCNGLSRAYGLGNRVAYFTFCSAFLLLSDHHNGAVGVANHRTGDVSHERASYPDEAPAAHYYHSSAHLLGQADDLLGRSSPRCARAMVPPREPIFSTSVSSSSLARRSEV